jgi:hypothetical protein
MPGSHGNSLTNPTTAWSANFLLDNNASQAFADLGLPWFNTADYANDVDALIAAAGAGPYVVNVNSDSVVSVNTAAGAGIHFVFQPGCEITVNNGVTLTIHSPEHVHCPIRQQAFVLVGTGVVAFSRAGTLYPGWWGAVGDGVTDDYVALAAALAATPPQGTLCVPAGRYRFTTPLTSATPLHIRGDGDLSCLQPDLLVTQDALTIGDGAAYVSGATLLDFSILSAGICRNGLVLNRLTSGRVRVTVLCGAVEYSLRAYGCINNTFEINTAGTGSGIAFARSHGGFWAGAHGGGDHFNRNVVHNVNAIHNGYCCWIEAAEQLDLSGTYEQADQDAAGGETEIYLHDVVVADIHDIYTERTGVPAITTLDGCLWCDLHAVYGNGGSLNLVGCRNCQVCASWYYDIAIDAASYANLLGPNLYVGDAAHQIADAGSATHYLAPIYYGPDGKVHHGEHRYASSYGLSDRGNLILNGSLSRWAGTRPDGWTLTGGYGITITQCGAGCADTTAHLATHSMKFEQNASGGYVYYTLPAAALEMVRGRYVTFSAWIRFHAGTPTGMRPFALLYAAAPSGNLTGSSSARSCAFATVDVWVRHTCGLAVPADVTEVQIQIEGGGATMELYIAEPCVMIGLEGQQAWIEPRNEFRCHVQIDGRRILWAAVMPAAGYYTAGEVVYNTAPALDGNNMFILGWSRLTTGSAHVAGTDWALIRASHVSPAT